jgi:hypothetical protein
VGHVRLRPSQRLRDARYVRQIDLLATILGGSKDWKDFPEFYATSEVDVGPAAHPTRFPVNVGPIRYTGQALIQRDVRNLKAALGGRPAKDGFMTAVVTGVSILPGEHYRDPEQMAIAVAEAVGRENVIASTDCGMGGRIHPSVAWAKLRALSEGAGAGHAPALGPELISQRFTPTAARWRSIGTGWSDRTCS